MLSTLLAIYGFIMVYQARIQCKTLHVPGTHLLIHVVLVQISAAPLEKMCVKPKFLVLQLVLIISNFQHVIISFFVLGTVVPCDPPLSAKANGDRKCRHTADVEAN